VPAALLCGTLAVAKWATATAFPTSRGHLAPLFERPTVTPRVTWGRAKPRPLAGSNPSDAARRNALRTCRRLPARSATAVRDERRSALARWSGDTGGVYGLQALGVKRAFGACAVIPRPTGRGTSRFSVVCLRAAQCGELEVEVHDALAVARCRPQLRASGPDREHLPACRWRSPAGARS
jgi:hypothetical protein